VPFMPRGRKIKESLKGKKIMSSDDEDSGLPHTSPFEVIRAEAEDGSEYWSARDLSKILGYTEWRNFTTAIEKAKEACENSGQAVSDHFVEANKLIETAKGARRKIEDYHLSRYGCRRAFSNFRGRSRSRFRNVYNLRCLMSQKTKIRQTIRLNKNFAS
jgi:DNA-directed RNA polymerase subunit N (RpoN/RPB10)